MLSYPSHWPVLLHVLSGYTIGVWSSEARRLGLPGAVAACAHSRLHGNHDVIGKRIENEERHCLYLAVLPEHMFRVRTRGAFSHLPNRSRDFQVLITVNNAYRYYLCQSKSCPSGDGPGVGGGGWDKIS